MAIYFVAVRLAVKAETRDNAFEKVVVAMENAKEEYPNHLGKRLIEEWELDTNGRPKKVKNKDFKKKVKKGFTVPQLPGRYVRMD